MDSILQKDTDKCFICHTRNWLECHHVFGAAYRKKSEKYGLVVRLCHWCHNEAPNGVHHNKEIRRKLQAYAQEKAMEHYGWDTDRFIKEFGRNYL
jgi:hypothetical protein